MKRKKVLILIMAGAAILLVAILLVDFVHWRPRSITVEGTVLRKDADDRRELPIANAEVTASDGAVSAETHSEASGYFKLTFPEKVWSTQAVLLKFRHDEYQPLDVKLQTSLRPTAGKIQIAAMVPVAASDSAQPNEPMHLISNIRVRYTVNAQTDENIGSIVRAFQAVNVGNVPCDRNATCSPNGKWKASIGSLSLDAGTDNEFRNVRASCIAGPCPFTRIDTSGFENGGRNITAKALDWSDTATFLLEAEVFHTSINSNVRESFPIVFGRALNFTLPPTQEGVSIEAEIDGSPMVFPLGPELYLSWATCVQTVSEGEQKTALYRCELKPGYKF